MVIVGTLAGMLILEGAARFLWKEPWYEKLLAEQRRVQTFEYRENSLGLRDRDYDTPRPAGTKRVLMIGDSFTFGMGVPDDRLIFPTIIERRLNEHLPANAGAVEILNAGKPATLTGDWVETWRRVGPGFEPDLLVVVFFLRDGTETLFIPEFFMRIRKNIVARNSQSAWYRRSYVFRMVRDQLDRAAIGREYTRRFNDGYFGNDEQTAEWRRAQRNLVELHDMAAAHSARMALVVFPVLVELNDDYPFRDICDELVDYGHSIGVPVFNLLDAFTGYRASDLWVSPWDQHPNARGHEIVADALLPFVSGLLDEGSR